MQNVDTSQIREAENYFITLKKSNLPPRLCRTILNTTKDPFVMFQISQCFALSMSRNYEVCEDQDVEEAIRYLLEMPIKQPM